MTTGSQRLRPHPSHCCAAVANDAGYPVASIPLLPVGAAMRHTPQWQRVGAAAWCKAERRLHAERKRHNHNHPLRHLNPGFDQTNRYLARQHPSRAPHHRSSLNPQALRNRLRGPPLAVGVASEVRSVTTALQSPGILRPGPQFGPLASRLLPWLRDPHDQAGPQNPSAKDCQNPGPEAPR